MSTTNGGATLGAFLFWGYIVIKAWGTTFAAWSWWWVLLPFVPWLWLLLVKVGAL